MAFWDRILRRTPPPRTAAVQPINENWQRVQSRTRQPWQTQARFFSENLGVIRFANGLLAQTAARCDLFVEELVDPVRNEWVPVENDPLASDIIYTYCGPDSDSAADLVARHVWHYKGAGEALDLDTLVATPAGFTRMGDLQPGDVVLGGDGSPCQVLAATEVLHDRRCYEVVLRNGARVVADENHLWLTSQHSARVAEHQGRAAPTDRRGLAQQANARKRWVGAVTEPAVVTTAEIRDSIRIGDSANHAIRLAAIVGDDAFKPPLDPYLLGYWLGDGTTVTNMITAHPDDQPHLLAEIERAGYKHLPQKSRYQVRVSGMLPDLRHAGVLGHKHIPDGYLRAGFETRWALLQGLIDSDGHVDKRGRVEFSNRNKPLLWQVAELASSLGLRVSVGEHRLSFRSAGCRVARLPRKAERITAPTAADRWNYVVAVNPVKSRPVRCIQVDSPDHTFLVTERFVRTHNCMMIVDSDPNTGRLVWSIRSTQAVDIRRQAALVMDVPGGSVSDGTARLLPVEQVRRLWVPDDEWVLLAQSPLRAVLADCERYWALARRIRREADSALTNGLLYTPGYAHTPTRPPKGPGDNPPSQFDLDYYRIAQRAFMDDDGVEAIAPMSVHYDAKDSTREPMAPKFIYPDRMLDPSSIALRAEAVESIARGLDMPQSLVTEGPGGGNHWSSWLVDEKFATTSLAPVMDRVTHNDLSEAMLRPVLRELQRLGNWNGDPRRFRIGYDPTPVIVHPDRAAQAIQLYGLGLLQGVVTLEANGFDGSNAPSPEELAQILETLRAARGRQPEAIQLTTSPISNPPQTQGIGETTVPNATTPGAQRELPPAPAMAALGPYPNEVGEWLDPVA